VDRHNRGSKLQQQAVLAVTHTCLLHTAAALLHVGRLLMGYVPEQYLHSQGTPRTVFLTLTAVMLTLAALATAYASVGHLYVISLLLGSAFGAHWSLLPAITRYGSLIC
jgi:hypothetical protein